MTKYATPIFAKNAEKRQKQFFGVGSKFFQPSANFAKIFHPPSLTQAHDREIVWLFKRRKRPRSASVARRQQSRAQSRYGTGFSPQAPVEGVTDLKTGLDAFAQAARNSL